MSTAELQALAVEAIREHRRHFASDEVVYEEWIRANDDPSMSAEVLKTLQQEYLERLIKALAQQNELSEILDVLGFIPDVPLDGASN
jgi:isopentenyl diphosphate isomerase/L-lactate dehydrogenase-like FMN-dependent dehydrogenase